MFSLLTPGLSTTAIADLAASVINSVQSDKLYRLITTARIEKFNELSMDVACSKGFHLQDLV